MCVRSILFGSLAREPPVVRAYREYINDMRTAFSVRGVNGDDDWQKHVVLSLREARPHGAGATVSFMWPHGKGDQSSLEHVGLFVQAVRRRSPPASVSLDGYGGDTHLVLRGSFFASDHSTARAARVLGSRGPGGRDLRLLRRGVFLHAPSRRSGDGSGALDRGTALAARAAPGGAGRLSRGMPL